MKNLIINGLLILAMIFFIGFLESCARKNAEAPQLEDQVELIEVYEHYENK